MSYQAAGFNPNQTAIRSVQPQATGANDAAATAPVYQPIRYAKDLQAAQAQSTSASRTHYQYQNQTPTLFYPATFWPFEVYAYDFQQQAWQHQPD